MKRWLRREVLMPILFLAVYAGALFLLYRKLDELKIIGTRGFMAWMFVASVIVYVVLVVTTVNHIASAYLLERFDPGDPASVRRLSHKLRFRLPSRWDGEAFARNFPLALIDSNFELENGDPKSGMSFSRTGIYFWTRRPVHDRVLLFETGPINIFRVDQLLKETIDRLDHVERVSRRNILVIAVRMADKKNVASAAAGCVNYMGRFQSGTLFPILVDINHNRMYFPVNRHFITREHRVLQNLMLSLIRSAGLHRFDAPGMGDTRETIDTQETADAAGVDFADAAEDNGFPGTLADDVPEAGIRPVTPVPPLVHRSDEDGSADAVETVGRPPAEDAAEPVDRPQNMDGAEKWTAS